MLNNKVKKLAIVVLMIMTSMIKGEVTFETGSLREFIGGSSPNFAYDNYVSHISEGIADTGYNDYGPDWLDVQTTGFGDYRILPEESGTLIYWRSIFLKFSSGNFNDVDELLMDSLDSFNYDLVILYDPEYDDTYTLLRERLDISYVDENLPDTNNDNVVGSFRNGWGLYIINLNPTNPNLIIEIPHPCDDFISPYIGVELFQQAGASACLISGAGREVQWTESGNYSNNKSLSDPSRNENTLFHTFHELFTDSLSRIGVHSPVVLQIHSFDNASHGGLNSIVLSGGYDASYANKPIRDITDSYLDFVNFTTEYPITGNSYGTHPDIHVTEYYMVHYDDEFNYNGDDGLYPIEKATSLLGPNSNVQLTHLHQLFDKRSVYEPWIQVELDEKPQLFDDIGIPLEDLYAGEYPTSYQNFQTLLNYYQPFIDAVTAYFENWRNVPDITASPPPQELGLTLFSSTSVGISWLPVEDTNFKTYRTHYDTVEVTETSPYWDRDNDISLLDMRDDETVIYGLFPDKEYEFRIKVLDHFSNESDLSEPIYATPFDPTFIEDFDDGEVELSSYADEDVDSDGWAITAENTFENSSFSLKLYGNTWKQEMIQPLILQDGDIWQVAVYSEGGSEFQSFGIMDDTGRALRYSLFGTQELNIEEWVPVYQGSFPEGQWNVFHLPVSDDWFAWYEDYPTITNLIFINDDDGGSPGVVYFDEILNIVGQLPVPPEVQILHAMGNIYQNSQGERTVDIQFYSSVNDPDSDNHQYFWSFGDDSTSTEENPMHSFLVIDDHPYTVLLEVMDDTDRWGLATTQITVDQGETTFPITINFVGDIMLARRYEENGGIIQTQGVEAIFEPTLEVLGNAADITVANMECPLTDQGEPHPTKQIVFRSSPENVAGLTYAGVDVVTLANNHSTDYMLEGLQQTQDVFDENDILYSGAGENSYEAYLPLFHQQSGLNIAFLASSNRTGQYNNYQPYLNAGYNKQGFAYMTPYYITEQIEAVRNIADIIVIEMHAGSEYSTSPGSDYDFNENEQIPYYTELDPQDEDYWAFLDIPHMWDREIRQFSIDAGADLIIVHHPHIIQGIEVYKRKVIAHSLGNFVFDLDYPETYHSMILNAEIDQNGFNRFNITPIYIDDYIPQRAQGELGLHILDYLAMRSRELDSYLHVDRETNEGKVILDTLLMPRTTVFNQTDLNFFDSNGSFITKPTELMRNGNISELNWSNISTQDFRVGREIIWMGNFEDEGSTLWNVNSSNEWVDETESYEGVRSLAHHRAPNSPDNIVTNFEERIKMYGDREHTLHGYIKTQNGSNVTIEIRYYDSRGASEFLAQEDIGFYITGDTEWTFYWKNLDVPEETRFIDIRMNSDIPGEGEALSWFDNVGVIEWSEWESLSFPHGIDSPNDYYYFQSRTDVIEETATLIYTEIVYEFLPSPLPGFTASPTIGQPPLDVSFQDNSQGAVGWWEWDFGDGTTSNSQNPQHSYMVEGVYTVSLTIRNYQGNSITEVMENLIAVYDEEQPVMGDVNGDGVVDVVDIERVIEIMLGDTPSEYELWVVDLHNDGFIDVFDIFMMVDIILGRTAVPAVRKKNTGDTISKSFHTE
tara:strand:+ start:12599 stop:17371 length:4773 start_codon:yes stop_codon:yes gene_type:complete